MYVCACVCVCLIGSLCVDWLAKLSRCAELVKRSATTLSALLPSAVSDQGKHATDSPRYMQQPWVGGSPSPPGTLAPANESPVISSSSAAGVAGARDSSRRDDSSACVQQAVDELFELIQQLSLLSSPSESLRQPLAASSSATAGCSSTQCHQQHRMLPVVPGTSVLTPRAAHLGSVVPGTCVLTPRGHPIVPGTSVLTPREAHPGSVVGQSRVRCQSARTSGTDVNPSPHIDMMCVSTGPRHDL